MDTLSYDKIRTALPEFFTAELERQYGAEVAATVVTGCGAKRPVTLRANTLKTTADEIARALADAGIEYSSVPWSTDAFVVHGVSECDLRALSIYDEGKIYMQSLSSMLPPIALGPRPGADILDMAAAPGSKTTQMAALSGGKAHITACERNPIRAERLKYNLAKQGASCVYVMVQDARRLDDFFSFGQILLDAPCSGSGTLDVRNPKLKSVFTEKLIGSTTRIQTAMLKKALRLLKPGCELVYSTCSVLARENEEIIKQALSHAKCEIVPISFAGMEEIPQLPTAIPGTICVCPNELYEGFFMAKIRRLK